MKMIVSTIDEHVWYNSLTNNICIVSSIAFIISDDSRMRLIPSLEEPWEYIGVCG